MREQARKMTTSSSVAREQRTVAVQQQADGGYTAVLIDDHETLRVGAAAVLAKAGISVVAEIDCAPCAAELAVDDLDLVVVDLQYGGDRELCRAVQGAEAVALVANRWPHARILVYTSSACQRCAVAATAAGSHGYIRKAEGNAALLQAVVAVLDGGTYVPAWLAHLIERTEHELDNPFGLTDRQQEVLRQVARGLTQQQVARMLGVSVDTVKEHLATLRARMQAASTIEAVRLGAQTGLVSGYSPPSALACSCWADRPSTYQDP